MDLLTIILLLSVGSFVFGLLLLIFQQQKSKTQRIPFWVEAKFLQGAGSLILFFRGAAPEFATVLSANSLLLAGCAYEAWAIFYIVGRLVSRRVHVALTAAIVIANLSTAFLSLPCRSAAIFLFQGIFYCLPGWILLAGREAKSWLRSVLGFSFALLALLNFLCALQFLLGQEQPKPPAGDILFPLLPVATFCMLLLALERSDRLAREADASLKKTEVQYRRIVETAIEGILAFDRNSKITYVNQNMAGMLGYTPEEMLGRNIREFIPDDQQSGHEEQMKKRARGQDGVYERSLCRKDGSRHWTLVSAKALADEDGQYAGSFAMLTDINVRKQLEAALQESEAKYRMFVEAAIEGVASLDSERRLTFVNRQFASMLGYAVGEMLGQPYESFMPEDQMADAEAQRQIRAQGRDAVYERCLVRKDGARHWTLVSAKAVLDARGQFIGSFGMFTDINARKQLEAALQASEAKYRMFVETAIEGVASLDSERRLTFVNRQFASMLGYAVEEMLGQPYESFMPEDQLADAEAQRQIIRQRSVCSGEGALPDRFSHPGRRPGRASFQPGSAGVWRSPPRSGTSLRGRRPNRIAVPCW